MDPVTTAILAGAAEGVTGELAKAGITGIEKIYQKLKDMIVRKFGSQSKVIRAIEDLEDEPKNEIVIQMLSKRINEVKVAEDVDIVSVAESLIGLLEQEPEGKRLIQSTQAAVGFNIAQASGTNSSAGVNVNVPNDNH